MGRRTGGSGLVPKYHNEHHRLFAHKWLGSAQFYLVFRRVKQENMFWKKDLFHQQAWVTRRGCVHWLFNNFTLLELLEGRWWSPWRRLKTCELKGWERMNWSKAWRSWRLQKFIKICTEGDREAKSILGQRQEAGEEEHDEKCLVLHLSGGGGGFIVVSL